MIPIEVEEGSPRVVHYNEQTNSQLQREELDLLLEIQEKARVREEALKRRMASRYNQKVVPRGFAENDLILIRNDIGTTRPGEGKLAAKERTLPSHRSTWERLLQTVRTRGTRTPQIMARL